ncbi:MAG TPA: transcriptional regulator [Puia sp.]|nr:transcriptional regulator [Puia sp.]
METLKYKIIKSEAQYDNYCMKLEELLDSGSKGKSANDEIELLTLLIEKWDEEHNSFDTADPVEILKSLMKDHKMKSVHLATLLSVSEGLVSDMLNYKKGLSKETIRILATRFKLNQEAFNRPYKLISPGNPLLKHSGKVKHKHKKPSRTAKS